MGVWPTEFLRKTIVDLAKTALGKPLAERVLASWACCFHRHLSLGRILNGAVASASAVVTTNYLLKHGLIQQSDMVPWNVGAIITIWFLLSIPHLLFSYCQRRQDLAVYEQVLVLEKICIALFRKNRGRSFESPAEICAAVENAVARGRTSLTCFTPNALYLFCHLWEKEITGKLTNDQNALVKKIHTLAERSRNLGATFEAFGGEKTFILPDIDAPAVRDFFKKCGDAQVWGKDLGVELSKRAYRELRKTARRTRNKGSIAVLRTRHACSFRVLIIDDHCFIQEAYPLEVAGTLKKVKYIRRNEAQDEFKIAQATLNSIAALLR